VLFPFFTLCWTQIFNNLIAQAGAMDLGSTPNDLLQNLSTVFSLTIIPLPLMTSQLSYTLRYVKQASIIILSAVSQWAFSVLR
jgi:hypothetical protein